MHNPAKEYATALFCIAQEENAEKDTQEALVFLQKMFSEHAEYALLLNAPTLPQKEKENLLQQAFGNSLPAHVFTFLLFLCKKGRILLFPHCAKEYEKMYCRAIGITKADILSAHPLTATEKKAITEQLKAITKSEILPQYTTDPTIGGGIIIRTDDCVFDGSIRRKLEMLKEGIIQ